MSNIIIAMQYEYKTIEGYENYEISSLGNVRNKKTGRILKQALSSNGYYRTGLVLNKKETIFWHLEKRRASREHNVGPQSAA